MTETLAIALAQINPTVGDIDGNLDRIRAARAEAAETGADLVICGELAVSGYPPEDLVLKRAFQDAVEEGVNKLAAKTDDGGPGILIGAPWRKDGLLYNAAVLLDGGDVAAVRFKHALPNYGVFDEKRIFETGPLPGPVSFSLSSPAPRRPRQRLPIRASSACAQTITTAGRPWRAARMASYSWSVQAGAKATCAHSGRWN